jgi:hypothetical protein
LHEFSNLRAVKKIDIDALMREDEQNAVKPAEDSSGDDDGDSSSDEDDHYDDDNDDDDETPNETGQHFVIDEQVDQMDSDTSGSQVHRQAHGLALHN